MQKMVINPLEYNTTVLRPINIGNTTIEKKKKYKRLGVILIKLKEHVAYIYGRACKDFILCVYYVKLALEQTIC
jgi:hypothetical protein